MSFVLNYTRPEYFKVQMRAYMGYYTRLLKYRTTLSLSFLLQWPRCQQQFSWLPLYLLVTSLQRDILHDV